MKIGAIAIIIALSLGGKAEALPSRFAQKAGRQTRLLKDRPISPSTLRRNSPIQATTLSAARLLLKTSEDDHQPLLRILTHHHALIESASNGPELFQANAETFDLGGRSRSNQDSDEGFSGASFIESAREILQPLRRHDYIAQIPASTYSSMKSSDLAALLKLIYRPNYLDSTKGGVPSAAWARLLEQDLSSVLTHWNGVSFNDRYSEVEIKRLIMSQWRAGHPDSDGRHLVNNMKLIPSGFERDGLIAQIPAATFARMPSAELLELFKLVYYPGTFDYRGSGDYYRIPAAAWQNVSAADLAELLSKWRKVSFSDQYQSASIGEVIFKSWLAANRKSFDGKGMHHVITEIVHGPQRDALITTLPASLYRRMPPKELGAFLSLVADRSAYANIPSRVWQSVGPTALEVILKRWGETLVNGPVSKLIRKAQRDRR